MFFLHDVNAVGSVDPGQSRYAIAAFSPASPRLRRVILHSAFGAAQDGGARRSRTDDILLAKQALYQLSYGPPFAPCASEGRPSIALAKEGEPSWEHRRDQVLRSCGAAKQDGRHGQTRTADLTLIRRTL